MPPRPRRRLSSGGVSTGRGDLHGPLDPPRIKRPFPKVVMEVREVITDLTFPPGGTELSGAFSGQRPGTTPDSRNVRLFEPSTGRARGGSRPGLSKFIDDQLPSGATKVQDLNVVVSTDVEALTDFYDYGDNPGEDPEDGVPDPSGPGWFYGPLDLFDPTDLPLVGQPGFGPEVPPGSTSLARLRPRDGTRTGGEERIVPPGGSARQPSWGRRKGEGTGSGGDPGGDPGDPDLSRYELSGDNSDTGLPTAVCATAASIAPLQAQAAIYSLSYSAVGPCDSDDIPHLP